MGRLVEKSLAVPEFAVLNFDIVIDATKCNNADLICK